MMNIFETRKRIKEIQKQIEEYSEKLIQEKSIIPKFNLTRPADQPPLEKDQNGLYKIVCPYCLTKFEVGDLLFRAAVVENGNAELENTFTREYDEAFNNYWTSVGARGQEPDRPHILNMDPDAGEIQSVTILEKKENNEQYVTLPYDNNAREAMKRNQVVYMHDKYNHRTMTRICPHCHTELPSDLGFVPNYIFSLLGNSGCGKSVYLLRLVNSLCGGKFMASGFQGTVINDESIELEFRKQTLAEKVFESNGKKMMEATDIGYIRPVIIRLINKKSLERIYITLFDFPGEGIWRIDDAFFYNLAQNNFQNSNGWMFMFDSGTLPFVNRELAEEIRQLDLATADIEQQANPDTILDQVFQFYGYGQTFTKPVAFILSKSDMIRGCAGKLKGRYISDDPLFLRHPEPHKKVNMTDLYLCDEEIRNLLAEINVTTAGDLYCQRDCAWFAISATNVPVIEGCIEKGSFPSGLRDTSPLEWLLYRCGQLEGEMVNAESREKEITEWATGFQIHDMEEYKNRIKKCENLVEQIKKLEMELKTLRRR